MKTSKYATLALLSLSLNGNIPEYNDIHECGWPCLYQPGRATYDTSVHQQKAKPSVNTCVFCRDVEKNDDANTFILKRYKHNFVALNLFPYKQGHLLVLPFDHVDSLDKMTPEARAELIDVISLSVEILNEVYNTNAANVGINLGRAAGATKPDHVHVQIVPRWQNDTTWMHIIAKTSVLGHDLHHTYSLLKDKFDEHEISSNCHHS